MQDSYNASYTQIPTEESLIIPECINWDMLNSVGPIPTNYRDRLITENTDSTSNSYIDDCNVPRAQIYIQKRRQLKLKLDINNIYSGYDSDDSDDGSSLVNVPKTIKIMDILYNTNFSSQLRSEQNISTISHYLKNIINKVDNRRKNEIYSIKKIVNVLNWIMQDWQIESIVKVIVNITTNWTLNKSKKDDSRLARLVRKITNDWDPQYIAHLVSILFTTHPLCNQNTDSCKEYKEIFLKVLSKRWKFCRLSQFFICLGNKGAINHKLKMHLLQRAAKFEDTTKKFNFNFNNQNGSQRKATEMVMPTSKQLQCQSQPQPQFSTQTHSFTQQRPQSQSVDYCIIQNNTNQNQFIILSSQTQTISSNQGTTSSTQIQSPHPTYYQIPDFQRFYTQSPLNDVASLASSSNSPVNNSPTIINSIPIVSSTPTSTNIPMVTIRSMNHAMTMNTQPISVVMTPPLNHTNSNTYNTPSVPMVLTPPLTASSISTTSQRIYQDLPQNYNIIGSTNRSVRSNSPSMIISNNGTTMPSTPKSSASETIVRRPQEISSQPSVNSQQGTPIQSPNIITVTTPLSVNSNTDTLNNNSILFSPFSSTTTTISPNTNININTNTSTINTTSRIMSPDIISPSSSTSSNHSKLKGKEEDEEDILNSSNSGTQSLLFMTPSTIYSSTINPTHPQHSSQPLIIENTLTNSSNSSSNSSSTSPLLNVSVPIPLSSDVRNIKQRIADLTLKAENNNISNNDNNNNIGNNNITNNTNNNNINNLENENHNHYSSSSIDTNNGKELNATYSSPIISNNDDNGSDSKSSGLDISSELSKDSHQQQLDSSNFNISTPTISLLDTKTEMETNTTTLTKIPDELSLTLNNESISPELEEKSNRNEDNVSYDEEIFNLDEFNHEEKKAIYDIIDSSKEDLDEIQMEKDEKIRSFIQENKKEFSNLSSSPKTPPPSLASSPFFQK